MDVDVDVDADADADADEELRHPRLRHHRHHTLEKLTRLDQVLRRDQASASAASRTAAHSSADPRAIV